MSEKKEEEIGAREASNTETAVVLSACEGIEIISRRIGSKRGSIGNIDTRGQVNLAGYRHVIADPKRREQHATVVDAECPQTNIIDCRVVTDTDEVELS